LGYAFSVQLLGAWYSSSGKALTAAGMGIPLGVKKASLLSQYSRADEMVVFVSQ
jgi:hypothetical protein